MIRKLAVVVGGAALAALIVWDVLLVDVVNVGPWTRSFNYRLETKAKAAGLIGRPDSDVEAMLGAASQVERNSATSRTFNYWPLPGVWLSKFQVLCHDGVVSSIELFDD